LMNHSLQNSGASIGLSAVAVTMLLSACSGGSAPQSQPQRNAMAAQAAAPARSEESTRGKAAPRGLPANAFRVQMVEIIDRNGFERPMPASYGFVPIGWKTQGGVQWGQQFACTNGYNVNWAATSPDGLQTIAVLPQEKWETNNYGAGPSTPGCGAAAISSVQQYLTQLVGRLRPGAQLGEYRPRPDVAAKYAQLNMSAPSAMGEMRTWVEAGQVQFTFNEQGREMRGVVGAAAIFSLSRMAGMGMGTMDALTGFVLPPFAATAPSAQFNPKFFEAIRQSFLANPEWEARISRHNTAIGRVAQQEAGKRSKIISEYNDYVSRIRQETADLRARSDERRQREFGEAIRGTETYDDPDAPGGRAELSGYYDHAWRLSDGTYVLSNDSNFEPWRDLGMEGKRLEATR
jgi:hypothetical protein